jgi:hypothetical protein
MLCSSTILRLLARFLAALDAVSDMAAGSLGTFQGAGDCLCCGECAGLAQQAAGLPKPVERGVDVLASPALAGLIGRIRPLLSCRR